MNKLPIAILAGAMAMSTWALADQPITQNAQPQAKDCSELSGKKKDKCVQATPAGPVNMTTGKQKKGKSDVAKERDRGTTGQPEPHPSAQSSDSNAAPKQSAATTGRNTAPTTTQ